MSKQPKPKGPRCTHTRLKDWGRQVCGNSAQPDTDPPRCGVHRADAVAKRRADRNARWAAEAEARKAKWAREDAIKQATADAIQLVREIASDVRSAGLKTTEDAQAIVARLDAAEYGA